MKVSDFNYPLPEELIASHPPEIRGASRLLVLDRKNGKIKHQQYTDFIDYVRPGDLVVLNDTKVIKARLIATNNKGQIRELLLLEDHHNTSLNQRRCLYRGKISVDERLDVNGTSVTVNSVQEGGIADISSTVNLLNLAEKEGSVPLPPYIRRDATKQDTERYQTVFARQSGSVAAPTASLNFTDELRQKLHKKGVKIVFLTLHVGLGTFLPIRSDEVQKHHMHSEYFEIPISTVKAIQNVRQNNKRVVAVGTTVARTLEYAHEDLLIADKPLSGETNIFIYPGYGFKIVDMLLTNFHAPKSTVLMLAAAFTGWDNLSNSYQEAVKNKYAFLSYGDSMLIL